MVNEFEMMQLMSGSLTPIIKAEIESRIAQGDKQLASAYKTKKFDDCRKAILDAFLAIGWDKLNGKRENCAMAYNGDNSLIGSAATHWYTEDNVTIESIKDILKGGTEVDKMELPKTTPPTPTTTSKGTTSKGKGKATVPTKATVPSKATVPTKATVPSKPVARKVEVIDDDDFDID